MADSTNDFQGTYDEYYYLTSCGSPYVRGQEQWLINFGSIADQIVKDINPKKVLDAGCAIGFLVEALRDRGVDAYGIDISEYAISQVREDIKEYCKVGSILEPLNQQYDLIITIEVLEHLTAFEGRKAIENLCKYTNDIIFTSTPSDYKEATHFNVQPVEYWVEIFAQNGFIKDVEYDVSYIINHAMRFKKEKIDLPRVLGKYERYFYKIFLENKNLREEVIKFRNDLAIQYEKDQELKSLISEKDQELKSLISEKEELNNLVAGKDNELNSLISSKRMLDRFLFGKNEDILRLQIIIEKKDQDLQNAILQVNAIYMSLPFKILRRCHHVFERIFPKNSYRYRIYRKIVKAGNIFMDEGLVKMLGRAYRYVKKRCLNPDFGHYNSEKHEPKTIEMVRNEKLESKIVLTTTKKNIMKLFAERCRKAIKYLRYHGFRVFFIRLIQEILRIKDYEGMPTDITSTTESIGSNINNLEGIINNHFDSLKPLPAYYVPHAERRLNMVTDSINSGSLFGGVATAIILSALLANRWECDLRIITRSEPPCKRNLRLILDANVIPFTRNVDFRFMDYNNSKSEIPVGDRDVFLTTSWWTTKAVKEAFSENRILYLLQEDERTFYPFGDERIRCIEVLKSPGLKFIINTEMLYSYLVSDGFDNIRQNGMFFEPSWPQNLFYYKHKELKQKKNFFFYARPNNLRNLFYLGLEVINTAITRGILNLDDWDIYFVGKEIPRLSINRAYHPLIYQNLNWVDYAALVRGMDLGLCLMCSPHPSYPPIDLASSGAVVVTNRFGNKQNLDNYSKNILCCDLDVESLVKGVEDGIELATNNDKRLNNYNENRILRDWKISFEYTLNKLERWPCNVSN